MGRSYRFYANRGRNVSVCSTWSSTAQTIILWHQSTRESDSKACRASVALAVLWCHTAIGLRSAAVLDDVVSVSNWRKKAKPWWRQRIKPLREYFLHLHVLNPKCGKTLDFTHCRVNMTKTVCKVALILFQSVFLLILLNIVYYIHVQFQGLVFQGFNVL